MDLVFNELSSMPMCADRTDCYNRVMDLIRTFKSAKSKGFKRIRFEKYFDKIDLAEDYTLNDFCNEKGNTTLKSQLLSIYRYPFIDEDSDQEESYIQNEYYLERNGVKEKCYGLAAAYLYSTSAIGFLSDTFWDQVRFNMIIENSETGDKSEDDVFCLSNERHVEDKDFVRWLERSGDVTLVETDLSSDEKEIKLRHDHGEDILMDFSRRIVRSPYVIKVINSLPFNPHLKDFIRKVYPDGRIEVVLTGSDSGIGIVVQTTGRTERETREIADILKREFYD